MIKLMAFDLDGTLLNAESLLVPSVRAAIARARAAGVTVTIATGRMFRSAIRFASELELGDVPLIVYNGSVIRTAVSHRLYREHLIPHDIAQTICDHLKREGIHVNLYHDDLLYVAEDDEVTQRYVHKIGTDVCVDPSILSRLPWQPTKMLAVADPERVVQLAAEIRGLVGDAVTLASSVPIYLEITGQNINKGTALAEVADMLGIARHEVLAAGDGQNDCEMVAWAGVGVAAHDAYDELRRIAEVNAAPGPDGIAAVIERAVAGDYDALTFRREEE